MKRTTLAILLIGCLCRGALGQVLSFVDSPSDNLAALGNCNYNRLHPELQQLADAYNELIELRFLPLKLADVTAIFGAKLDQRPGDRARPVFAPMIIAESGLGYNDLANKRHVDFHAVGPAGYLEARYQYDGETVATCVLYLRTNSAFIPLQSTNDITARMAWDKTQFELLRQWLEGHLPKVTDLGVVEVSESKPTRVELGAGAACILTTRVLNHPDVTNLWFTVDLAKETADLPGKNRSQQHRSINQPDKAVGFSIDGRFYRVTPRLIDPIRKPDK